MGKKPKIVKISEMGNDNLNNLNNIDFSDYDEDTIFVLDDPPLRNPNDKDPKKNKQSYCSHVLPHGNFYTQNCPGTALNSASQADATRVKKRWHRKEFV